MAQAELNVMTAGHVDHGKTTLVQALTGKWTSTHSEELKRGITIKLGYADATIRKCPSCAEPQCYTTEEKCQNCGNATQTLRKVSFVDAPGHETLMATVIAASSIVDGALFVIAATEKCPQAQTLEHLMVLEAAGIKNVVVAQNKADLVSREQAKQNYGEIEELLKGTSYEDAAIVPTAANTKLNLDALIQAIQEKIPTPKRDVSLSARMYVARSFDVNKPGTKIEKIVGGVIGGSIVQGRLRVGEEIEVLPGFLREKKGKEVYEKIPAKILSLNVEGEKLEEAVSGGLIGVGTTLDPALTHADSLVGCVVGKPGTLPEPKSEAVIEVTPVKRALASFREGFLQNEPVVLGIGTETTVGAVVSFKKKRIEVKLKKPVVPLEGEMLAIMRRSGNRWHLYGTGKII
jgi:translation initiation factor 2 subunit 3